MYLQLLSFVRTQQAYAYQLQGKNDDAQKLYNQVLKSKYVLCGALIYQLISLEKQKQLH